MTEQEALDTIAEMRCLCGFCADLQEEVSLYGLAAVRDYRGMICPSVDRMIGIVHEFDRGID